MEDKVITVTNEQCSITDDDGFCMLKTKHDSKQS
jgi:hypothetical protein